jgi:hypothetical protein
MSVTIPRPAYALKRKDSGLLRPQTLC